MRKFNLDEPKFVLTLDEIGLNELINYLITLSVKDCVLFLDSIMDKVYTTSDDESNSKVERFIGDSRIVPYNKVLLINLDDDSLLNVSDNEWKRLESIAKKFYRSSKLKKMNGEVCEQLLDFYPSVNFGEILVGRGKLLG